MVNKIRMSRSEASKRLGKSPKTIKRMVERGEIDLDAPIGKEQFVLVPENIIPGYIINQDIDKDELSSIPPPPKPSELDIAKEEEAIEQVKLSTIKSRKERLEIEGLLQKPEVLTKLELQLTEKERELTEKESVIKLWENDLKDKTNKLDEYIEGLEVDQKEADEIRDKYNQLLEDIKEREQALYNLTISAQNSMNEATAKLYEIKSVYATADELMAMLDRVWGYVSAWVNASSDKEKKIQTQFVMGWLPEAKQLYRKLKNISH